MTERYTILGKGHSMYKMWHRRESHLWGTVKFFIQKYIMLKKILNIFVLTSGVLSTEDTDKKDAIDDDMIV